MSFYFLNLPFIEFILKVKQNSSPELIIKNHPRASTTGRPGAIYLRDVDGKEYIIGTYCNIKYNNMVY